LRWRGRGSGVEVDILLIRFSLVGEILLRVDIVVVLVVALLVGRSRGLSKRGGT